MKPTKRKRIGAIITLTAALAGLGSAYVAPLVRPAVIGRDNPVLIDLRRKNSDLQGFTAQREKDTEGRLAFYRRQNWTENGFKLWADTNVRGPAGWILNDLGPADLKHVTGRRYAMQRPNATADDWPAIARLLQTMESAPCVSVVSVTLTVGEGIVGSQHFSQCLLIGVFYFSGDDARTD